MKKKMHKQKIKDARRKYIATWTKCLKGRGDHLSGGMHSCSRIMAPLPSRRFWRLRILRGLLRPYMMYQNISICN
jgi:hypothetical protein